MTARLQDVPVAFQTRKMESQYRSHYHAYMREIAINDGLYVRLSVCLILISTCMRCGAVWCGMKGAAIPLSHLKKGPTSAFYTSYSFLLSLPCSLFFFFFFFSLVFVLSCLRTLTAMLAPPRLAFTSPRLTSIPF